MELTQSYADQAMAALGQALQKGYKEVANLETDQDLMPLHSRNDFKKLVAGLDAKLKHAQ